MECLAFVLVISLTVCKYGTVQEMRGGFGRPITAVDRQTPFWEMKKEAMEMSYLVLKVLKCAVAHF
jgi:hypothetical protein